MKNKTHILEELTRELKVNSDLLENHPTKQKRTYSKDIFEKVTEESITKALGRKYRKQLALLGSFVEIYSHVTSRQHVSEIYPSTHSPLLLSVFKNSTSVSRVIKAGVESGLLVCVDNTFNHFGKTSQHHSKVYVWNKDAEDVLKTLIKKFDINYTQHTHTNLEKPVTPPVDNHFEKNFVEKWYKVAFSSKLRISHCTDAEALAILNEKYPLLKHYQALADEMNTKLDPDNQIIYIPNINRSSLGNISGIGIRATCRICSLKEHENGNENFTGVWRKEYLKEYFGTDKIYSYDVKSSIFRINYLLNHGEWLDNDIDLYEIMNGSPFSTPEARNDFKPFALRCYFEPSGRSLYNHIKCALHTFNTKYHYLSETYYRHDVNDGEIVDTMTIPYGQKVCIEAFDNIRKTLGKTYDNEIFFHESNIYLDAAYQVRKQDIKLVQIYDGFYSNVDLSFMKDLIRKCSLNYYQNCIMKEQCVVVSLGVVVQLTMGYRLGRNLKRRWLIVITNHRHISE